jgi:hypothetical protein
MPVPTDAISAERLDRWRRRLMEQHATPFLLLGIGHDHAAGKIVLCVPENVSDAMICATLRKALLELEGHAG